MTYDNWKLQTPGYCEGPDCADCGHPLWLDYDPFSGEFVYCPNCQNIATGFSRVNEEEEEEEPCKIYT